MVHKKGPRSCTMHINLTLFWNGNVLMCFRCKWMCALVGFYYTFLGI